MSDGVRTALLGLVGLLVLILGCLIAAALILRRRATAVADTRAQHAEQTQQQAGRAPSEPLPFDPMACPSCRREFEPSWRFCPHDASRLVPGPQMLARVAAQKQGSHVCLTCRRAYEGGIRYCPHDGGDLVPMAVYEAACNHDVEHEPTGVVAKICPRCQGRYDYASIFCGKDGVELVVLN